MMNEWSLLLKLLRGNIVSLDDKIDYEALYKKIRSHDLETLFYDYFKDKDQLIAAKVQKEKALNLEYYRTLYNDTKKIFLVLNEEQISYAVVKGLFFAIKSYNDPSKRSSSDIDILVDKQNYGRLKAVLLGNDFIQGYLDDSGKIVEYSSKDKLYFVLNTHQSAPYIKRSAESADVPFINIDVNLKVTWGELKSEIIRTDELLNELSLLTYNGIDYSVLNNENAILSYCLNVYKDNNSIFMLTKNKGYRIRQLSDIYYFIKNNKINWYSLKIKIEEYGIADYIHQILYLVAYVFDDFSFFSDASLSTECPESLQTFGLDENEKIYWNIDIDKRLSSDNLNEYVYSLLSKENLEKISINDKYLFL